MVLRHLLPVRQCGFFWEAASGGCSGCVWTPVTWHQPGHHLTWLSSAEWGGHRGRGHPHWWEACWLLDELPELLHWLRLLFQLVALVYLEVCGTRVWRMLWSRGFSIYSGYSLPLRYKGCSSHLHAVSYYPKQSQTVLQPWLEIYFLKNSLKPTESRH